MKPTHGLVLTDNIIYVNILIHVYIYIYSPLDGAIRIDVLCFSSGISITATPDCPGFVHQMLFMKILQPQE